MSEADQLQAEVYADGVEVRKTLNVEDFSVPSLVFTIRGPPNEPALISVRDTIPDDFGAGNIGFHPKHGGQYWTFDGNAVTFSRRFEPGEEYTTVYGIVGVEPSTAEWLSAEPSVDRSGVTGGPRRNGDATAGDDVVGEEGRADGLLERLANELAGGQASESARARVRSELGVEDPSTTADLEAAVGALADRVEALESSVPELTDSHAEAGAAPDIAGIRDRLDAIEAEISRDRTPDVESIRDRVVDLEADTASVAALGREVDTFLDRVDYLESSDGMVEEPAEQSKGQGQLRDDLDEIRSTLEAVSADVEDARTGMQRNARDIDDIGAELTEVATTVESSSVAHGADAARVAELEATVRRIAEDLEAAMEFQDRLSSTLLEMDAE